MVAGGGIAETVVSEEGAQSRHFCELQDQALGRGGRLVGIAARP